MTRFSILALALALAATPALAQDRSAPSRDRAPAAAEATVERGDGGHNFVPVANTAPRGTRRLSLRDGATGEPLEMSVDEASRWADTVCGGDSILLFDYHEDGSVDEDSYDFDCLDDL